MAKWLANEAITAFYGPRMSAQEVARKYTPRIEGSIPVIPCIAETADGPIGFVQYYMLNSSERMEYGYDKSNPAFGMDQLIGNPAIWGKGMGTLLVTTMSCFLFTEKKRTDDCYGPTMR
ncbi:GNAT family N-acetyltransferase [Heyndrickxia acidicola]|uniref:GNAT family N-acetyltransferase n=1 Tax=Heyndrickxia acidicola TaxID=209389 RepID=A0ABU6MN60_9BACI|nr:GNAT family N-acetyltransferase [Heyndrickxia acidicola]MED1204632.1 GNAT family N-acetyltransferase [Heyndrickxia acidicola]